MVTGAIIPAVGLYKMLGVGWAGRAGGRQKFGWSGCCFPSVIWLPLFLCTSVGFLHVAPRKQRLLVGKEEIDVPFSLQA